MVINGAGQTNIIGKVDGTEFKCLVTGEVVPKLSAAYYQSATGYVSKSYQSVTITDPYSTTPQIGSYVDNYDMSEADFSNDNTYAVYEIYTTKKATLYSGHNYGDNQVTNYTDIYVLGTIQEPKVKIMDYSSSGKIYAKIIPHSEDDYTTLRVYATGSKANGIINLRYGEYVYNLKIDSRRDINCSYTRAYTSGDADYHCTPIDSTYDLRADPDDISANSSSEVKLAFKSSSNVFSTFDYSDIANRIGDAIIDKIIDIALDALIAYIFHI